MYCKEFADWLNKIAKDNYLGAGSVFALWKEYTKICQGYDQSPVKSEFLDWNNLQEL
jgi:hypothetical protein